MRATCDENKRNPVLGLVRVDQSPHIGLEVPRFEVKGLLVDTFIHEKKALLVVVPDDRLLFS